MKPKNFFFVFIFLFSSVIFSQSTGFNFQAGWDGNITTSYNLVSTTPVPIGGGSCATFGYDGTLSSTGKIDGSFSKTYSAFPVPMFLLFDVYGVEGSGTVGVYISDGATNSVGANFDVSGAAWVTRAIQIPIGSISSFSSIQIVIQSTGSALGKVTFKVAIDHIRLQMDNYGTVKELDSFGDALLAVGDEKSNAEGFNLKQNYPNPFNPTTTINYSIPKASNVQLKIYDVLGKEVATLVNEGKIAGSYSVNFDASMLSSGIYFYSLKSDNLYQVKRMILLK